MYRERGSGFGFRERESDSPDSEPDVPGRDEYFL